MQGREKSQNETGRGNMEDTPEGLNTRNMRENDNKNQKHRSGT